ncbi:cytochrome P450 [Amycolatopsis endophytica]|uniref:Cytochrome P450 n=1 Tax=Amycolatopsis endophytica TaxID=860233 RepID=A0A853BA87_9PSEU|nr:cytochrome P450 [Amycolatopsis endophytica]NYI91326.1 cytochrome P450 [Amycolatopsis endophytica]
MDARTSAATVPADCPEVTGFLPWTDPRFRIDPYPYYARALAEAPIMRDDADGSFVLTRYEDLMHYGRLPSIRIAPEWKKAGAWRVLLDMALGHDEPGHTRLRRQTSKWFTPKRVREWAETTAGFTDRLLDGLGPDGLVDGSDLAVEVTHRTVCHVLDVPADDHDGVRRLMRQAMPILSARPAPRDFERAEEALDELRRRTAALIELKRANPGEGLLDSLLGAQDRGEMSAAEVLATTLFFYVVGHMDATYLICSGLHLFTREPELLDAFRAHPDRHEAFVAELARFDAPEPVVTRTTTEDLVIHGVHVPAGSSLRLMLGAANHDPAVFDNPDEFDFTRPPEQTRNLTFSFGSHGCQGRLLAEAEIRVVFERISARYSRVELTAEPDMRNTDASRHYYTLPLRLHS